MDTHTARRSLSAMWPLVFNAMRRPLDDAEVSELRRLTDLVKNGVTLRPELRIQAQQLHAAVLACGILDGVCESTRVEQLLQEIDRLKALLL